MSKTICFYHSDMDGICSAAIVNHFISEKVHHYKVDYGLPFPWDVVGEDDLVFMVDYALKPNEMDILREKCSSLIWIDHHKTAIEGVDESIPGLRRMGVGACELVWEWFGVTDELAPLAVTLIGMYDIWEHTHEDVLPFQYGIRARCQNGPEDYMWYSLFGPAPEDVLNNTINGGKIILDYIRQEYKVYMETTAFKTSFQGIPTIAINRGICSSMIFDELPNREDYAIFCTFFKVKEGFWKISLYSNTLYKDDVDVSKIALSYGGGGHKGASGFESTQLPFQLDFERNI